MKTETETKTDERRLKR